MRKRITFIWILILTFGTLTMDVEAIPLGRNITMWDGVGSGSGWRGGPHEDNEVEPGNKRGQPWDLEGFFLNGWTLTMVGGFNFVTGRYGFDSGDIFIDIDGDARFGLLNKGSGGGEAIVTDTFGYDYVLDVDFDELTYEVYALNNGASSVKVHYHQNDTANPWRYHSGGDWLQGAGGSFDYWANLPSAEVGGLRGRRHYAAAFDLGFLDYDQMFTVHFALECGNDNLMGYGASPTPTPEPGTFLLLGAGILGMVHIRGKLKNQVR